MPSVFQKPLSKIKISGGRFACRKGVTIMKQGSPIQIGLCASLFDDRLLSLPKTGARYAEVGFSELSGHTKEEIAQRAALLHESGVPTPAANVMFPGSIALTGPQAEKSRISEYLDATLEKASSLGLSRLVLGSGGSRRVPEGFSREQAFEQLCVLCRDLISPALEKYQIICCIEPLNQRECNILNTCRESAKLVRAVNKENIRLLVDLYHFQMEREEIGSLSDHGDILAHAHIASEKNNRALPGQGDNEDYTPFFQILHKIGYEGMLSLEGTISDDFFSCVQSSVAFLNSLAARS